MKRVPDVKKLPGLVGMLGVLGFVLRFALYLIAVDEKKSAAPDASSGMGSGAADGIDGGAGAGSGEPSGGCPSL